jgi:DNA-binding response OmpR family regulator
MLLMGGTMTKVLVAEDSATVRRLVAGQLKADGFEVVEAADGEEAVEVGAAEAPDLLVLDKVMPGLNGFEVIRALRQRTHVRVPVVMLTEETAEEDVLEGLSLSVAEYIPKPFSPEELSTRVRRALRRA